MANATDKQIEMLVKLGVDRIAAQKMSKNEAMELIAEMRNRPTPRQTQMMLARGLTIDQVNEHTVETAFMWIAQNMNRRA